MSGDAGAEPPVPLIELRGISRTYETTSGIRVEALRDVSVQIRAGEFVAVVGQSGSGKTTLLNLLGCLDQPTCGEYLFDGQRVGGLDTDELSRLRGEAFGFVFQNYNLIANATARENVELPGLYSGVRRWERTKRASGLFARLGIPDCADRLQSQLSGGQQQRAAIARALVNDARVILADEPTGALDSHTGNEVIQEFKRLAGEGRTVVLITHDPAVAAKADRRIKLLDGSVSSDDGEHQHQVGLAVQSRQDTPQGLVRSSGTLSGSAEMLRTSARSLRGNLLRTTLTLLGILIGVASVVALMFIGESSRRQVVDSVYRAGADLMTVRPDTNSDAQSATLGLDDVLSIESGVPGIKSVMPEIKTHLRVKRGAASIWAPVTATSAALPQIRDWPLATGTFFTEHDGKTYEPVAVIGSEVADELFGEEVPVGQYILVGTEMLFVIGVLEERGGIWGSELDRSVFVPLLTGSARLVGRWALDSLMVQVEDPEQVKATAARVKSLLERWHGEGSVDVSVNADLLKAVSEVANSFRLLLGSIAGISLLVGGIGIMNMLLTSVTERTREIGIRMAVGARRSDILRQFLTEAVLLSSAGAVAGLLVGAVVGNLVIEFFGGSPLFTLMPVALALGSALVIGLVFGYAPARRAARMDPARALAWE